MIAFLKYQRVLILFVASLFIFHWFSKDITDQYERPIGGDAQGYYSYLPALFIYHDFDYKFIDEHAKQYYADGHIKDFIYEVDGQKVNKTFPGASVLYAPFFFLAHGSALVLGYPADGFSSIYQFWFDIGHWFYFLFSLIFLKKLLEKLGFSSKIALFSTILIGIGTNVFFYTVYDQSVTHIHNFFMINGMLLCLALYKEKKSGSWLLLALVLLALIGITRPTNILAFGLIFFFFHQKQFYIDVIHAVFGKKWWKYAFFVLPILALPFVLWKAQTGNWVVYSYGDEGFNFSDPHFREFIFSYTKGWMTYTPIVIPILLIGLYLLFKQSKKKATVAIAFYLISIYVFSSWWCWYYGAGMSQRVMIDHYVLLAFLLAVILKACWERPVWRASFISICVLLSAFNIAQAYQIKNGILQFGSATKAQYWDNFMRFDTRARVYPKDHWLLVEEQRLTEKDWNAYVDGFFTFSGTASASIEPIIPGSKIVLSFDARAYDVVEQTRAVIVLNPAGDSEEEMSFPFYLSEFVRKDEWVKMEFLLEPNGFFRNYIKVFFWNADTQEHVEFRDVQYKHYWSDEYY